jgi:hypothetical protein
MCQIYRRWQGLVAETGRFIAKGLAKSLYKNYNENKEKDFILMERKIYT